MGVRRRAKGDAKAISIPKSLAHCRADRDPMFKFDIAVVISAVRSPLQFAALLAILAFLAFLVLRFGTEPRPGQGCGAGLTCPSPESRGASVEQVRITLEYGRRLH